MMRLTGRLLVRPPTEPRLNRGCGSKLAAISKSVRRLLKARTAHIRFSSPAVPTREHPRNDKRARAPAAQARRKLKPSLTFRLSKRKHHRENKRSSAAD